MRIKTIVALLLASFFSSVLFATDLTSPFQKYNGTYISIGIPKFVTTGFKKCEYEFITQPLKVTISNFKKNEEMSLTTIAPLEGPLRYFLHPDNTFSAGYQKNSSTDNSATYEGLNQWGPYDEYFKIVFSKTEDIYHLSQRYEQRWPHETQSCTLEVDLKTVQ